MWSRPLNRKFSLTSPTWKPPVPSCRPLSTRPRCDPASNRAWIGTRHVEHCGHWIDRGGLRRYLQFLWGKLSRSDSYVRWQCTLAPLDSNKDCVNCSRWTTMVICRMRFVLQRLFWSRLIAFVKLTRSNDMTWCWHTVICTSVHHRGLLSKNQKSGVTDVKPCPSFVWRAP